MRISTECKGRIQEKETALFVSVSRAMENDHIFLRKAAKKKRD